MTATFYWSREVVSFKVASCSFSLSCLPKRLKPWLNDQEDSGSVKSAYSWNIGAWQRTETSFFRDRVTSPSIPGRRWGRCSSSWDRDSLPGCVIGQRHHFQAVSERAPAGLGQNFIKMTLTSPFRFNSVPGSQTLKQTKQSVCSPLMG